MTVIPTDNDVILGRGRGNWRSPGNKKYKIVILQHLQRYSDAPQRKDKSLVINDVMKHMMSTGARFLKKENGIWVQLTEKKTREKIAHAVRDFHSRWKKGKVDFEGHIEQGSSSSRKVSSVRSQNITTNVIPTIQLPLQPRLPSVSSAGVAVAAAGVANQNFQETKNQETPHGMLSEHHQMIQYATKKEDASPFEITDSKIQSHLLFNSPDYC